MKIAFDMMQRAALSVNCTQRSENQQVNNLQSRSLAACERRKSLFMRSTQSVDANPANNNNSVIAAERIPYGVVISSTEKEGLRVYGINMIFNCARCFDADADKLNIAVHANCKKMK